MKVDVLGGDVDAEIVSWFDVVVLLEGYFEGEPVGIEAFVLINLWLAEYFELILVLRVVDLYYYDAYL